MAGRRRQKRRAVAPTTSQVCITTDEVVTVENYHHIRRLAGPVFEHGRYVRTVEWWLVEGVPGKFLSFNAALRAAMHTDRH